MMLSDVCRVHPGGVCGRLDSAYWLIGPARPAWLKAAPAWFRCRPGQGHIVAAARLQLVWVAVQQPGRDVGRPMVVARSSRSRNHCLNC